MKKIVLISFLFLAIGCQRTSNQAWENVKTAKNYFSKAVTSLWGKDSGEAVVEREEEFLQREEAEYLPLNDSDLQGHNRKIVQKDLDLSKFKSPDLSIFKNVNFETDNHVIKMKKDLIIIDKIAQFMKKNKDVRLSIEGHCDERASAKYNIALGTRRANHVKNLLKEKGVDVNRLYSVSYGKEKPISFGHTLEDFKINRRVEFKISR